MAVKAIPFRAKGPTVKKSRLVSRNKALVRNKPITIRDRPTTIAKQNRAPLNAKVIDLEQRRLAKKIERQGLSRTISTEAKIRHKGPPKLSDWSQRRLKQHSTGFTQISGGLSEFIRAASSQKKAA